MPGNNNRRRPNRNRKGGGGGGKQGNPGLENRYTSVLNSLYALSKADGHAGEFFDAIHAFMDKEGQTPKNFWERSFGAIPTVPWNTFLQSFTNEYQNHVDGNFTWLCNIVKTQIFKEEDPTQERFATFRGQGDDPNLFWKKLLKNAEEQKAKNPPPPANFWERSFPKKNKVSWAAFLDAFFKEYKSTIDQLFPGQATWIMDIIHTNVFGGEDPTLGKFLIARGTGPDPNAFWTEVKKMAEANASSKPSPNFWARVWPTRTKVTWDEFLFAFIDEYKTQLNTLFPGQKTWVIDIIKSVAFKNQDPTLTNFLLFRGTGADPNEFLKRVQAYAGSHNHEKPAANFWGRHFGEFTECSWADFSTHFKKEYQSVLTNNFKGKEDEVMALMQKKVFDGGDPTFHKFLIFRGTGPDKDAFSKAVIALGKENGL